jgi:hypothetical protein
MNVFLGRCTDYWLLILARVCNLWMISGNSASARNTLDLGGGGVTLLTEAFSKGIECQFWGRTTGFNMFGKRSDEPHCDNVQIMAGDATLTPVNLGKIDFKDHFQVTWRRTDCCLSMPSTARRLHWIKRLER